MQRCAVYWENVKMATTAHLCSNCHCVPPFHPAIKRYEVICQRESCFNREATTKCIKHCQFYNITWLTCFFFFSNLPEQI